MLLQKFLGRQIQNIRVRNLGSINPWRYHDAEGCGLSVCLFWILIASPTQRRPLFGWQMVLWWAKRSLFRLNSRNLFASFSRLHILGFLFSKSVFWIIPNLSLIFHMSGSLHKLFVDYITYYKSQNVKFDVEWIKDFLKIYQLRNLYVVTNDQAYLSLFLLKYEYDRSLLSRQWFANLEFSCKCISMRTINFGFLILPVKQ